MFTSKGLFKHIICPNGAACRMPNCMFGHEFPGTTATSELRQVSHAPQPPPTEVGHEQKRRKLDDGTKAPETERKAFTGGLVPGRTAASAKAGATKSHPQSTIASPANHLQSAKRPVSPPPKAALTGQKAKPGSAANQTMSAAAKKPLEVKKETLNPRRVAMEPEKWGIRTALLEKLHEMMLPLNKQAGESSDPELKALHLDDTSLIKAALDEEEGLAQTQGKVYKNMIKLRIMAYKKMKIEEWKQHRLAATKSAAPEKTEPKVVDTGLSPEQETMFLQRLIANQVGLDKHGYVTAVPTDAEIEQARLGVEMSANYEVCDRCRTRFQVFPERRVEDGALTTGSHCTFHWGKTFRPQYKRTEAITGRADMRYTCCQETTGSPGCSTLDTHVFKISETKRLALVLPFIATPPNPNAIKGKAICFDCEMGYTVYGMELIRLTVTSWPDGEPLIDVLVRPLGTVLDLNTRFSGVTPDQFFNAQPYDPADPASANPRAGNGEKQPSLRIVSSPAEARSLFLSFIAPETPVLGHALENDLNSIRLVHPTIVDTVLLYPIRGGLPSRPALKGLVKGLLGRDIQTAGAAGHDSLEDSRATGELVRVKVEREWRQLKSTGWTARDDGFYPPHPEDGQEGPATLTPINPKAMSKSKKRKGSASNSE
ncbi:rna exonuclease [Diplodia corticola]|uniref:Rna exonuclease n=1 Tax=Diplodia corticola TaxID=236234 RepID=A0A1J9RXX0_9PEZI|nr:rna exonuclease [Diplodia corticola]OJD33207.1 rna exonuclease [Diplodia corticola]